jgi:hypothetical protein
VTSVDKWTCNHPDTGHIIVGHILMWSPTTQALINQAGKAEPAIGPDGRTNKGGVHVGPDFDKDADF